MNQYRFPKILFTVFMIVTLLLGSCSTNNSPNEEATPTPLPTAMALARPTYVVQRGEVVQTVNLVGRIAPVDQQPLYFPIDGRVQQVYVQDGDAVKAGDVIADLDGTADIKRQLELGQLRLKRSQLNAEIAQFNFDLFVLQTPKGSAVYEMRLAIEQDRLELAKLDVDEASLGLQELQDSLAKLQLVSPMDGQITSLQISAGTQVHSYVVVGKVADASRLEVSASFSDPTILNKIEVGMVATLSSSSGLGTSVTGLVRRLPVTGSDVTPVEQDKTIRISMDRSPGDLGYKIGDLLSIVITVVKKENVLWIPPQTIRNFGGRKFVVVQDGDLQRRVDVKLGVIGEDRVEILEGLTEGQVVVSP